jgi:hypothetical protein
MSVNFSAWPGLLKLGAFCQLQFHVWLFSPARINELLRSENYPHFLFSTCIVVRVFSRKSSAGFGDALSYFLVCYRLEVNTNWYYWYMAFV